MSRFTTYAIREISSSFLLLIILLSSILWLGQGLRHIELLTTDNVSFIAYLSYILLLLPKILLLTIPICLFLSILFNINRLRNDSELIILWASGKSDHEILFKPIIFFAILIYLLSSLISIYVTPYSLNEIRHKIIDIRSSGIQTSILKEKKFISPIDTLTIFLQKREGNKINGLLIHDLKDLERPQTYIAQQGEFIEHNNKKILRLFNGNIQIFDNKEKKISEIEFETYDLNLAPYSKRENNHIYSDELYTHQILDNLHGKQLSNLNKYEKEQFAELHSRIVNPIYIFCFALIPLMILKISKKPGDSLLIPITTVSIFAFILQILQMTISNLLIETSNLVIFAYILPIILFLIIFFSIILDKSDIKQYLNVK
jgi:lipopolysaccharide export system permease protein